MPPRTADDFLQHLRERGARRVRRVTFRRNRSTIWSLTAGGTALNVHAAFRDAPDEILDAFAVLAGSGARARDGERALGVERAREAVRGWPGLAPAMRRIRARHAREARERGGVVRCAGTPSQGAWLRAAYAAFNRVRLHGALPEDVPLRFSRRMRSALGHMRPGADGEGRRRVLEIALNLDLLLEGNEAELRDTLLHEMAHAAAWLEDGERGHGEAWRRWARRAGCVVQTRHHGGFRRRRRRGDAVDRVPALPREARTAGGRADS